MDAGEDGGIRTGNLWTGTAHALTAMVGSGILTLPWCVAQLGWILGPLVVITFAAITYCTALLLCDCYRTPNSVNGRRNYTYSDAVRALLGPKNVLICSVMQYSLLWGTMIGFTITTATSIVTMTRSTCRHQKANNANCGVSGNLSMLIYGAMEIILSQCPNLSKATFLSLVAAVTSVAYALIASALSTAKFLSHPNFRGSLTFDNAVEGITLSTRVWQIFQALGNVAFAYTYSILQLEIQDTLRSTPPENEVMKKVSLYAIGGTTMFYIFLACMGFLAFGNSVPGNILTGFDHPFWLVDIGNLLVIIHLIGAYQVFSQPVFAIHEKLLALRWPTSFLNAIYIINVPSIISKYGAIQFTLGRLLLRTIFVIFTTGVAMMFPFFNAVLGVLGSISFWPLTVHFPLSMYMAQTRIERGSLIWMTYQILSLVCLVVSTICFVGSIADILERFKHANMFHIEP